MTKYTQPLSRHIPVRLDYSGILLLKHVRTLTVPPRIIACPPLTSVIAQVVSCGMKPTNHA